MKKLLILIVTVLSSYLSQAQAQYILKDNVTLPTATIYGVVGNLKSSTYTPTLTNTTNISSSTAYQCQYYRVGDVVTVLGHVDITPTVGGAAVLSISLPIASNFATIYECTGFVQGSLFNLVILGDATNDDADLNANVATPGVPYTLAFTFTYYIL